MARDPIGKHCQIDALHLLVQHGADTGFIEEIAGKGASADLRQTAFGFLVKRQHRPTIERALSALLADDQALRLGETGHPIDTSLGWIAKIRSEFAVPKLAELRARALDLELPRSADCSPRHW